MKISLTWLKNYIKLEHTPEDFGSIMTALEFMQDGPIKEINNQKVIELEVRQNRPDMLSIIGTAREYAAYINKKVSYPEQLKEMDVKWDKPQINLSVQAKDSVKRFCAVEVKNIKVCESPEWMKTSLETQAIPSINNLVDITNYVMLEYGIPLHVFDVKKLARTKMHPLITVRNAILGEKFKTWQGTELELTTNDLVVADSEKPVAIAGIIGGANSDINLKTRHIILESAVYDHADIRKTSLRHSIRTDASTRHEKFLNPEMVEITIKRALYLIKELCGGEIIKIEDHYEQKPGSKIIDFNIFEIERLGGIQIDDDKARDLLERLGFKIIEQKSAIGINKNVLIVHVPIWRTDVNYEADLIEEVLRLNGYDKIPVSGISSTPPDYSTPLDLQLEEKIRDILVNLGLNEHITNPLVKFTDKKEQIKLENPLNSDMDGLRTTLRETLSVAINKNKKAGNKEVKLFEVGKIFKQIKVGEYKEERRIESLYSFDFMSKQETFEMYVKPDFLSLLYSLGFKSKDLKWRDKKSGLEYLFKNTHIANLFASGFELITQNIVELVDVKTIPATELKTTLTQRITEELSLLIDKNHPLGEISDVIKSVSEHISSVEISDLYEDAKLGTKKASVTLKVIFEDAEKGFTKESIDKLKKKMIKLLSKNGIKLRG